MSDVTDERSVTELFNTAIRERGRVDVLRGAGTLQPDGSRRQEPTIPAAEVARAVVYMASLPLEANVLFMTVMATAMPYVGRG